MGYRGKTGGVQCHQGRLELARMSLGAAQVRANRGVVVHRLGPKLRILLSQAPQWRPGGHDDGWAVQINPPAVGTRGRGQVQDGACHDVGTGLS